MNRDPLRLPRELRLAIAHRDEVQRADLRDTSEQFANVSVVAETTTAADTMAALNDVACDLVISGPTLRDTSGFSLSRQIQACMHSVSIIIASHTHQVALEAFDAGATDFIVKPFGIRRLRKAFVQVCALKPALPIKVTRIAVRRRHAYVVIDFDDVIYFEARDRFVWTVTQNARHALDMPLSEVESLIGTKQFFRSHRSTLVRVNAIREVLPTRTGRYELLVEHPDHPRVPLSRNRFRSLRARIPFT